MVSVKRRAACFVLVAGSAGVSCSGDAPAGLSSVSASLTATSAAGTIVAAVPREFAIQALPNAACFLSASGSADPTTKLRLIADDTGTVRFFAPSGVDARLELGCEAAAGVFSNQVVDLAATPPGLGRSVASAPNSVRPAITGDPMRFAQAELLAMGYAWRPDPASAPDAYSAWLRAASKPSTRVLANVVPRPDIFRKPPTGSQGALVVS